MGGWLCPCCGAENPFSARRCRACGHTASAGFLAREIFCTIAERLQAEDTGITLDLSKTLSRTNRLARRLVYVTAVLFVIIGVWTGMQTAQASGLEAIPGRLSDAVETAGERAEEQVRASVQEVCTSGETAVRQLTAACDGVEERINSASPLSLYGELETARERTAQLLLSIQEANASGQQWDAFRGGVEDCVGNISTLPLRGELEDALERTGNRAGKLADAVQTEYRRVSDQLGKLTRTADQALQSGKGLAEVVSEAFEALKALVS